MTKKEKIEILISQYHSGKISEKDKFWLMEWKDSNSDNMKEFDRVMRICKEQQFQMPLAELNSAREQFKSNLMVKMLEDKKSSKKFSKIAAVVILFILIGSNSISFLQKYNFVSDYSDKTFAVYTASGEKSSCVLPDSTKVWLNSTSKVNFRWDVKNNIRFAQVDGETFFDVTKSKMPFLVESGNIHVKVYGTQFNVRRLLNKNIEVSLKEGSVEVFKKSGESLVKLSPGQKVVVSQSGEYVNKTDVDVRNISLWKESEFVFRDHSLEDIASVLSDIYGVKVVIKDEKLKDLRFRCIIRREKTLINTLENLSQSSDIQYSISKGEVLLSINN